MPLAFSTFFSQFGYHLLHSFGQAGIVVIFVVVGLGAAALWSWKRGALRTPDKEDEPSASPVSVSPLIRFGILVVALIFVYFISNH